MIRKRFSGAKARLRNAIRALLTDPAEHDLDEQLAAFPSDHVRRAMGADPDVLAGLVSNVQHAHALALGEVRAWRARWAALSAWVASAPSGNDRVRHVDVWQRLRDIERAHPTGAGGPVEARPVVEEGPEPTERAT